MPESAQGSGAGKGSGGRSGGFLGDREFAKLWAGETASLFGTQVTALALPLAALSLGASAFEMGALKAAQWLPFALLALPAGLWVDRVRRRPVLVASNLFRAGLLAIVPLLAFSGVLAVWHLLAVSFAVGACAVLFELAYQSYLPSLVGRDELVGANGKLAASDSAAEVGGPGLGGVLVGTLTAPVALLFDALTFLFAAAAAWRIRRPEPKPGRFRGGEGGLRRELLEGFRETFSNRYLLAFAGEAATYNVFWTGMDALFLLWAVRELGLSAGAVGLLISLGACGALLGALLSSGVAGRFGAGATMIGAAVVGSVGTLLIPLAPPLVAAALGGEVWGRAALGAALFLRGVGITGCNVQVFAARQAVTPDDLLGRVNAVYRLLTHGLVPVGALLGGFLGEAIGLRPALVACACGLFFSWAWLLFSPARSLRDVSALAPATVPNGPEGAGAGTQRG